LQRSFDPKTHPVPIKADIEITGDAAVAMVHPASVPLVRDDCGLTLGDVVQNFRASLDHLAWDLVWDQVKAAGAPRPKRPQDIYFPMAKNFKTWTTGVNAKLPGVPDDQRAVIRRYQPYRRGRGPRAMRWLRDLSDRDKHRVTVPVARSMLPQPYAGVESNWRVSFLQFLVKRPVVNLTIKTPLLRIDLVRPPGVTGDCHVNVQGEFPVQPALRRGRPVMVVMVDIRDTVLEILTTFDEML